MLSAEAGQRGLDVAETENPLQDGGSPAALHEVESGVDDRDVFDVAEGATAAARRNYGKKVSHAAGIVADVATSPVLASLGVVSWFAASSGINWGAHITYMHM